MAMMGQPGRSVVAIVVAVLLSYPASPGEVSSVHVSSAQGLYTTDMLATIDIPTRALFAQITDFDNLDQLSKSIQSSSVVSDIEDQGYVVALELKICWLVCHTFRQTQHITTSPPYVLHAEILSGDGNLFVGSARWELLEADGRSMVKFRSQLTPQFWVPTWIGPWMIERLLRRESLRLFEGLERTVQ